jgi:phage gpG-like protein
LTVETSADLAFVIVENVAAKLRQAAAAGNEATPAMAGIARMIWTATRENFINQKTPLGLPWLQSKAAEARGGQTLIETGDLFSSIIPNWSATLAEAGPENSGGAAVYARIYQWGGVIKRKAARKLLRGEYGPPKQGRVTVVARPYVGWNDRMRRDAHSILAHHLAKAFASPIGGAA